MAAVQLVNSPLDVLTHGRFVVCVPGVLAPSLDGWIERKPAAVIDVAMAQTCKDDFGECPLPDLEAVEDDELCHLKLFTKMIPLDRADGLNKIRDVVGSIVRSFP